MHTEEFASHCSTWSQNRIYLSRVFLTKANIKIYMHNCQVLSSHWMSVRMGSSLLQQNC